MIKTELEAMKKVEAILKLKSSNNAKKIKSFLDAIQYLATFLLKLSEKTDRLRKFLKKNETWNWEGVTRKTLTESNKCYVEKCWAHYAKDKKHGYNGRKQNRTRNNIMAKSKTMGRSN